MEMSAGRPQNILRTYFYRYWHKHTVRVFSLNAYKDESVVRFLRCLHISNFFLSFLRFSSLKFIICFIVSCMKYYCVKSVRIPSLFGLYLVQMLENTIQRNSEYGDFSRNV